MSLLRCLGGLVRSGLVWMVVWGTIGASLSIVVGIIHPPSIDPGEGPVDLARILGSVGLAAGLLFGGLLTVGERRRAPAEVPVLRAALWGALAGAAVGLIAGAPIGNTCPFGALAGILHVALARAARRLRPSAV